MNELAKFERPTELGGVYTPGLPLLPHGVERHLVPGGGSRAVEIRAGDLITVVDREGLQTAELVFFLPDGRSDAAMIGADGGSAPVGLQIALAGGDASGRRVLKALEKARFDIGRADAARAFTEGSNAGDSVDYTAQCDGLLIICAPGAHMLPEAQNTVTELAVYVRRAKPGLEKPAISNTIRWQTHCRISMSNPAMPKPSRFGQGSISRSSMFRGVNVPTSKHCRNARWTGVRNARSTQPRPAR